MRVDRTCGSCKECVRVRVFLLKLWEWREGLFPGILCVCQPMLAGDGEGLGLAPELERDHAGEPLVRGGEAQLRRS